MMYRPKSTPPLPKYDMTVGILPVKDKRVMNFYWYKDDLFEEPFRKGSLIVYIATTQQPTIQKGNTTEVPSTPYAE